LRVMQRGSSSSATSFCQADTAVARRDAASSMPIGPSCLQKMAIGLIFLFFKRKKNILGPNELSRLFCSAVQPNISFNRWGCTPVLV
jgi:hypothetical protein